MLDYYHKDLAKALLQLYPDLDWDERKLRKIKETGKVSYTKRPTKQ